MTRVLLILALVATAFWVYTIVDCALQPPTRHRGVSKGIWIAIVVLLPVLGGILWFAIGRGRRPSAQKRRAPDDDPEFLGRIGSISDQDERIRRLEEELAQLDSEASDPLPPAAPGAVPPSAAPGTIPPAAGTKPADGDDDSRGQRGAVG
jgi:hypothetical protein